MKPSRIRLPADVEMEDRLAWGLTARQLVILAVTAIVCYGVFAAAGSAVVLSAGAAYLGSVALGTRDSLRARYLPSAHLRA